MNTGRIKLIQSPYVTISARVTSFTSLTANTSATPLWSVDTFGNLFSPNIDGEILKVVINYVSGFVTSVWTVATRDVPSETILNLTGTKTDTVVYPRHTVHDNTGTLFSPITSGATIVEAFAIHGSLMTSCSGVAGEGIQYKVYYR